MSETFSPAYTAAEHEKSLYELWEKSGAFSPIDDKSKPAYCMIMPPPNANGNLHAGHALNITLQDIMVRYHRMKGERVLWIPGSDHAGIETQVVYEKVLEKEGRSRFQMTREQFYEEVMRFTLENKQNMEQQIRSLGASCDWKTNRFTLDETVIKQTYATFRRMYEEGLIYRGERIVNYCVKYQTAYADIEVLHEERKDPLYYLQYGPLSVATVRPETTFGDVAVAVHPKDKRYKEYIGKTVKVKFATGEEKELPVIADDFVNPEFGTGAVKVTPAHDPNDFEMAQRHDLPVIETINTQGRLTEVAGQYAGLKAKEARQKVAEKLAEMGLIVKVDENYCHSVGLCYKSMTEIEPLVLPQWYVRVDNLRARAIEAIESGEVEYYPASYKKIQLDWLKNLRDWNISRQIWWGIPINQAMPEVPEIASDPDTFDTWFSSSQWPYIVLQAMNEQNGDRDYLAEFYPTDVLSTARDIIFSWVSRMIMMGLYTQDKVPFHTVYLHGMVLDRHGKKMSKSKGNVINPLDLSSKYGSDALRFGLAIGTTAGSDLPLPEEKIIGGRNFANKLWNISRYVNLVLAELNPGDLPEPKPVTEADKEILEALARVAKETGEHIENFRFSMALQNLHDFIWRRLADQYLEASKKQADASGKVDDNTAAILYKTVSDSLKLLHPFMPFVTEAIYQRWPKPDSSAKMLITAAWPSSEAGQSL